MSVRVLTFGVGIIGLGLLVASNMMYFSRTKAKPLTSFWLRKDVLSRSEYLANRVGFWLAIVGIAGIALAR